jgi:uncharacterized protein (DUF2147 family)
MLGKCFKGIVIGLFLVLSMSGVYAAPSKAVDYANSPAGLWTTIDDKTNQVRSIIRVWESNGVYYGRIEKIFKQPGDTGICSSCPGNFRNKPILGLTIIWGLKRTGDRVWSGGQILDPHNGKVYRVMLTLSNDGRSLRARGYIGFSVFGRTQNWYRRI